MIFPFALPEETEAERVQSGLGSSFHVAAAAFSPSPGEKDVTHDV